MPWNSGGPSPWGDGDGDSGSNKPSDGGGNGKRPDSPWGKFTGGGGNGGNRGPRRPNPQMPDLDAMLAKLRAQFRALLPGGVGNGRGALWLVAGLIAVWLASGFYRVQPDEKGVVLRFGAYDRLTDPGLNYHAPWPIETVDRPAVTHINRVEIGFRSNPNNTRQEDGRDRLGTDVLAESLMLTGDENIIDIDVAVFWRISDPVAFLFNTREPIATIKAVSESAMREVIGRTPIQPALTEARAQIEQSVLKETQTILDSYRAGVEITQVQLQKADPPEGVIESFRDVQRANTDAETVRNEAEKYRNGIVPLAGGNAERLIKEADGARQSSVLEATGQTQRFNSVLAAYNIAKDVTMRRMYIETMQDVLTHSPSIVVDDGLRGVVPFLPLNGEAPRTASAAASVAGQSRVAAPAPAPAQGVPQ